MKDKSNLHLKVQELCDCYATTDPLKEMSEIKNDADTDEAALKWLALAALHGVNNNAKKISVSLEENGEITVKAKYRETELPSPGKETGKKIFDTLTQITHIENDEGKTQLALGIRNSSIDLNVKIKTKDNKKEFVIKFAE